MTVSPEILPTSVWQDEESTAHLRKERWKACQVEKKKKEKPLGGNLLSMPEEELLAKCLFP